MVYIKSHKANCLSLHYGTRTGHKVKSFDTWWNDTTNTCCIKHFLLFWISKFLNFIHLLIFYIKF